MWSRSRAPPSAPSTLAIAARYVLSPAIFEALARTAPGVGGEIQLTDAIRRLMRDGGRVYGMALGPEERRFDIGNFDAYFRAFVEFALADPAYGPVAAGVRRAPGRRAAMIIIRRRAYARAALVGNPPTGIGGRPSRSSCATSGRRSCSTSGTRSISSLTEDDRARFRSVHDLARDVALHGYYGGIRLIKATVKRFVDYCRGRRRGAARAEFLDPLSHDDPAPGRPRRLERDHHRPRCAA